MKTRDIHKLLKDQHIPQAPDGHPHRTEGWVSIHCPFCIGSKDFHLGISENGRAANCWRCGTHSVAESLSKTLNIPVGKAIHLLNQYTGASIRRPTLDAPVSINPFKLPACGPIQQIGKAYLEARGFDPDKIAHEWGVKQTGPISRLDGIDYSRRLVIPIHWNDDIVSFQTRDMTDRAERKYLACPKQREKVHHKDILYGRPDKWQKQKALVVVEGVTDVWRLGTAAVATFGIKYKMTQILELAKAHSRFFILFDNEPQAQIQARALSVKLKALRCSVQVISLKDDPGSLKQDEADDLMHELLT